MNPKPERYFKKASQWRRWLLDHHQTSDGIYLIFYKVSDERESMRWEDAVKVALCFGWIDSTVKSLGDGRRRQYFCPRRTKSVWSAVNKKHIAKLKAEGLMHPSGLSAIKEAKKNGSWTALDDVEKGVIPEDLADGFKANPAAYQNFLKFSFSYQKSYLYWLNQAKREATRRARIREIIALCAANKKSR